MVSGLKRVCVFCGSSAGRRPEYRQAAEQMGRALARRGIELVYGGGHIGLMGVLADAALAGGGRVIGVIPKALEDLELGHRRLSELRVVGSMHERKALMAELSEAFVALPGGFGTLDEFCEVLTWSQLGFHAKACGLLNVARFFDPLLTLFDHAVTERFLRPENRRLVLESQEPDELLEALARFVPPPDVRKWILPEEV